MKKFFTGFFGITFCLSLLFLSGCNKGAGLTLVLDSDEEIISSGMF